jgi:hypothetical protein
LGHAPFLMLCRAMALLKPFSNLGFSVSTKTSTIVH